MKKCQNKLINKKNKKFFKLFFKKVFTNWFLCGKLWTNYNGEKGEFFFYLRFLQIKGGKIVFQINFFNKTKQRLKKWKKLALLI